MSRSRSKTSRGTKDHSGELIESFQKDCLIRGLTPESTVRYISTMRIFNGFLQERGVDLLEVEGYGAKIYRKFGILTDKYK
jgi:hypothetical protein